MLGLCWVILLLFFPISQNLSVPVRVGNNTAFFFLLSEAQPEDEDDSQKVRLFGAKLPLGQVEAAVITLAVIGLVLLLIAAFLLGVVIYLRRQRKLRLNRRSILDDGFKLMSKKNSGL